MTDVVAIECDGQNFDLHLDHETYTWMPIEASDTELLGEDTFPLIAVSQGSRYELFGDGTFAHAEF